MLHTIFIGAIRVMVGRAIAVNATETF